MIAINEKWELRIKKQSRLWKSNCTAGARRPHPGEQMPLFSTLQLIFKRNTLQTGCFLIVTYENILKQGDIITP